MLEHPSTDLKWGWAESPKAESWSGPFDSLQQAEDYGRRWARETGEGNCGVVATVTLIHPEEWVTSGRSFDLEALLEEMEENLSYEWPCFDDKVFDIPAARKVEAEKDLVMMLGVWASKYVETNDRFVATGIPQEVKP